MTRKIIDLLKLIFTMSEFELAMTQAICGLAAATGIFYLSQAENVLIGIAGILFGCCLVFIIFYSVIVLSNLINLIFLAFNKIKHSSVPTAF